MKKKKKKRRGGRGGKGNIVKKNDILKNISGKNKSISQNSNNYNNNCN